MIKTSLALLLLSAVIFTAVLADVDTAETYIFFISPFSLEKQNIFS